MPRLNITLEDRFWSKVVKTTSCWIWTGWRPKGTYGSMHVGGDPRWQGLTRNQFVHRVSWRIHKGPIPDGMLVLHTCDNPPCVNPDHLFLGTHSDNNQDKINKGREARGSKQHLAKLTESDIPDILNARNAGLTYTAIASRYKVTSKAIGYIIRRATWKHVPWPTN